MTIEPKTKIGETSCPGCAATVPLKVNGKGGVYFYCAAVLERNEAGKVVEQCFTRFNFGRTASRRLIAEFLANGEAHAEPEIEQADEIDSITTAGSAEPAAVVEPAAGDGEPVHGPAPRPGFGAKLKHFLTAD